MQSGLSGVQWSLLVSHHIFTLSSSSTGMINKSNSNAHSNQTLICPGSSQLQGQQSVLLTISSVESGESRGVANGQLGGAPEGGRRQVGHQRPVTHLCPEKKGHRTSN